MKSPPTVPATRDSQEGKQCLEDPFISLLGFKTCMIGWRVVRLMVLSADRAFRTGALPTKPSIYTSSAQIVLARLAEVMGSQLGVDEGFDPLLWMQGLASASSYEKQYLDWATAAFSERDTWPVGSWMVAVWREVGNEIA